MPRIALILNHPILKVATSESGIATAPAVECQVTSAVVTATPNYSEIPATGCSGATQSPGLTSWALELAWLQDWGTDGLSYFAFENDALPGFIEFTPDSSNPTDKLTGPVYISAGGYGGTFGDGSAATATATWPFSAKPTIPAPVVTAAA